MGFFSFLFGRLMSSTQFPIKPEGLVLRARLIDNNGNYIRIGIDITKNIKCCNVMLGTIHSFGDKTIIEP